MSRPAERAARRDNVEQVFRRVREAILTGAMRPGSAMSQVALADELGVSRTPLREALRMLQSEGLVDAQASRRVTVKPVSAADLEQLTILRVVLEREAIQLSVRRLAPASLPALEAGIVEMARFADAGDFDRWSAAHETFHRGLTAPAGERFRAILTQLSDHFKRYRRMHIECSPKTWMTLGHIELLEAMVAGDRDESGRLIVDHLAAGAFDLMEVLQPGYDSSRLRETLEAR